MVDNIKDKYTFVSQKDEEWASVMITEGKFKDVIYRYGKVSIPNEEEIVDGSLPFRFEYDIVDNVGISREEFGEDFFTLIGDILVDIINVDAADEPSEEDNFEHITDD
jgi:hypothetical protein